MDTSKKIVGLLLAAIVLLLVAAPLFYPAAVNVLSRIKQSREAPVDIYNEAEELYAVHRTDYAKEQYSKLLELYPQSTYAVDSLFRLADIVLGDLRLNVETRCREAVMYYRKITERNVSREIAAKAMERIAYCYRQMNETEKAIHYYELSGLKNPASGWNTMIGVLVAQCYIEKGEYEMGREILVSIIKESGEIEAEAEALYDLADSYYYEARALEGK